MVKVSTSSALMIPSARIEFNVDWEVFVSHSIALKLKSSIVRSTIFIAAPYIQSGESSTASPFSISAMKENEESALKSRPRATSPSASPPPRSRVILETKSETVAPNPTISPRKNAKALIPSSSPKVGTVTPLESTSLG